MKAQIENLGKVAITVEEDYWSDKKDYDKLTIVEVKDKYATYISRIPVPAGTSLTNRKYWIPFSSLKEEILVDFNAILKQLVDNGQLTLIPETEEPEEEEEVISLTAPAYHRKAIATGVTIEEQVTVAGGLLGVDYSVDIIPTDEANEMIVMNKPQLQKAAINSAAANTNSMVVHNTYTYIGDKVATFKLYLNGELYKTYEDISSFRELITISEDTEFKLAVDYDGKTYTKTANCVGCYPTFGGYADLVYSANAMTLRKSVVYNAFKKIEDVDITSEMQSSNEDDTLWAKDIDDSHIFHSTPDYLDYAYVFHHNLNQDSQDNENLLQGMVVNRNASHTGCYLFVPAQYVKKLEDDVLGYTKSNLLEQGGISMLQSAVSGGIKINKAMNILSHIFKLNGFHIPTSQYYITLNNVEYVVFYWQCELAYDVTLDFELDDKPVVGGGRILMLQNL